MFAVPAATPVTTPEEVTIATEVLELVQAPPPSPLLEYCAVAPIQSGELPLTTPGEGSALTVSVLDADCGALHPLFTVYIMLVVPVETALTTPAELTVAMDVLELVHDPPASPLLLY